MPTERSEPTFDVAVVGAGPAGLAAAVTAADAGRVVAVLDLGDRIGGQYYRHPAAEIGPYDGAFHHGWRKFLRLRERFEREAAAGRIEPCLGHAVWSIEHSGDFVLRALVGERERRDRTVRARAVIVAAGAHDRHVPFPGWTLPGVMAVGGAQALLKGSLVPGGRRAVVAGTGPFLLSVADGLLAAGVEVAAVAEAAHPAAYARRPAALAGALAKLPEAAGYAARLARHRTPYLTRRAVLAAHGGERLEAVTIARVDDDWQPVPGSERRLACDLLAVGYGFSPQLELALQLGCGTARGEDGALAIAVDGEQRTSVEGVFAAGETTGIGGADLAMTEGALAGAAAAGQRAPGARRLRARRARGRRFAELLQEVHPVRDGWVGWLDEDTLVCRCEEVSCGQVREAVIELGASEARTVKLLARPGMGWCQGRICGSATATLTASLRGRQVEERELAALARRPFAQPVPLSHLKKMET